MGPPVFKTGERLNSLWRVRFPSASAKPLTWWSALARQAELASAAKSVTKSGGIGRHVLILGYNGTTQSWGGTK